MDTTEKEQLAQEQLDALKAALKRSSKVNNTGAVSGSIGADTIALSSGTGSYNNGTIVGGGYTLNGSLGPNATPYFTTGSNVTGINWGAGSNTSITANPWATTTSAGRMELNGDNADLVINGVSLMEVLRDRLNVMIPNPELEKEWAELRELGDQYRKLEADLKEKAEIWNKLKS